MKKEKFPYDFHFRIMQYFDKKKKNKFEINSNKDFHTHINK